MYLLHSGGMFLTPYNKFVPSLPTPVHIIPYVSLILASHTFFTNLEVLKARLHHNYHTLCKVHATPTFSQSSKSLGLKYSQPFLVKLLWSLILHKALVHCLFSKCLHSLQSFIPHWLCTHQKFNLLPSSTKNTKKQYFKLCHKIHQTPNLQLDKFPVKTN
jgi:hypothetical protein